MTGIPLADPLELLAVGQPETLSGSLTRAGGPIAQLGARYPEAVDHASRPRTGVSLPPTDRDLDPQLGKPRL